MCDAPASPYQSTIVASNKSISFEAPDFSCVINYKWSDNVVGSKNKSATCKEDTSQLNASWAVSDNKTCIGNRESLNPH